jgi:predicted ABC-type ATPase
MTVPSPRVIMLAGPNGAGKTTSARTLLAETLRVTTYVNADVIAQGLSGFDPDSAAFEAGRIMVERLRALAARRANFAFETTLAARSYASWLSALRETGYTASLYYFWLQSADLATARVALRVQMGGHHVPETIIRRRYDLGMKNFFRLYRSLVDVWQIYDTSRLGEYRLIAQGDSNKAERILDHATWQRMKQDGDQ